MAAPVIDSASIRFVVDDRERRSEVVGHLKAIDGLAIHFERLPTGDYRTDDRLLFERKRLDDFAASVIDGRLFSQLSRLVSGGYRPVLVLEGSTATLGITRIRREALQGALITASVIFGVPVLRSFSSAETARLMVYTARKVRAVASGALPRHGRRPRGKRKLQIYILQGLPGIGKERAARLLDRFGSVENVFTAPYEELIQVHGIGRRSARAIRWAVG